MTKLSWETPDLTTVKGKIAVAAMGRSLLALQYRLLPELQIAPGFMVANFVSVLLGETMKSRDVHGGRLLGIVAAAGAVAGMSVGFAYNWAQIRSGAGFTSEDLLRAGVEMTAPVGGAILGVATCDAELDSSGERWQGSPITLRPPNPDLRPLPEEVIQRIEASVNPAFRQSYVPA